jgi:hypothetical protein
MSSFVSVSAFDVKNITFSNVKTLDSGAKSAYVNYNGGKLIMQVGSLETTFGLSEYNKPPAPPSYSVDLKLRGYDDPANHPTEARIYQAFNSLDEYMLEQGVKNSVAWFKGAKSKEVLKELYSPMVRFAVDKEGNRKPYPPTIKVKLRKDRDTGKFATEVYDKSKQPMTVEDAVVKGASLTCLIQCTGLWFQGSKYNLSWTMLQIRADKVPQNLPRCAIEDDGEGAAQPSAVQSKFAAAHDDEVDDDEALAPPPKQVAPTVEDDEVVDEEAPPPVPKPAPKAAPKKILKKPA